MAKQTNNSTKKGGASICVNRKARHDYFIEDQFEAGLVLSGWEVKSLRQGKCQLVDSYVLLKHDEAWLVGALFTPLGQASTHILTEPRRTRKLLLKRKEINRLAGQIQAKGYTCVALELYWKGSHVKCKIGLAKGKQQHDKRAVAKERDWNKQKERLMKRHTG